MFRLLQGDVGSGKTIVALVASMNVISSGFHPNSKEVVNTLIDNNKFKIKYVDLIDYHFPKDYKFEESDAAFVVSYPHFEGTAEDLSELVNKIKV